MIRKSTPQTEQSGTNDSSIKEFSIRGTYYGPSDFQQEVEPDIINAFQGAFRVQFDKDCLQLSVSESEITPLQKKISEENEIELIPFLIKGKISDEVQVSFSLLHALVKGIQVEGISLIEATLDA